MPNRWAPGHRDIPGSECWRLRETGSKILGNFATAFLTGETVIEGILPRPWQVGYEQEVSKKVDQGEKYLTATGRNLISHLNSGESVLKRDYWSNHEASSLKRAALQAGDADTAIPTIYLGIGFDGDAVTALYVGKSRDSASRVCAHLREIAVSSIADCEGVRLTSTLQACAPDHGRSIAPLCF
ncbi:unnamed protein product [Parajaminaea phylloscopi]